MVSPYYIGNAGQPDPMMQGINDAQTIMMNQITLQSLRGEMQQQQQAAQAAAQQEQRNKANLDSFFQSGDKSSLYQFLLDNPKMAEAGKAVMSGVGEDQKRDALSFGARFDSALSNGAIGVAKSLLNERIKAAQNAGDTNAVTSLKTYADALDSGDKAKINTIHRQHQLEMALMDGDYAKNLGVYGDEIRKRQLQPFLTQKTEAEAQIEQSKADYANATNQASLQAKLTDTEVALRNAASTEERNRLEREKIRQNAELTGYKIDQAKYEKEQRLSSANAVVFDIENSIETVKALKVHAGFERAVGFSSYIPSIAGGDAANFEKMLETLKSQSFLVSIQKMQGMGALSNAEGEKLQIALASLDVGQSEPQLRTNLNMIEILFKKGLAQAKRIQSTVRPKEEESWNR